jgi:WD40 repeat protein/serine/threonine protein kinase
MNAIEDQARSIFLDALDRAPDAWPAFLDQACGADAELRGRVAQLLRAHQAMGSIHCGAADAPAATTDEPRGEGPSTVIGSYKLLEQIGEGGFGVVFMAEQTQPVRRKVALKVLKPGMDTRQVVARFEAERQALALMDHPNIAHVFDGGTTTGEPGASATGGGRPYFVMELVRGVPITAFCDQNRLSVRDRLALFVDVCSAVQHAHLKGIIHRDLKPSNVLVSRHDTTPVVKVIDFGVAKALGGQLTDRTVYTGFVQMIGTPLYMSPEQAGMSDLDVDTRSDIYSLGVLLYELLTGTTPVDRERLRTAGYDEMRRIIREEEPPRPSTRQRKEEGGRMKEEAKARKPWPFSAFRLQPSSFQELDWIVMKALEKDRNRRYQSASAFAADVQRYLHDEPVQACPPSKWYRFRKFARRHKAALATATAVAAAALLAVASLVGAVRVLAAANAQIRGEQRQTKQALGREKQANDRLRQAIAREQLSVYFQRVGLAQRDLASNNIGSAEELLAECPARLRGWEWHLLKRQPFETPLVVPIGKVWVGHLACSADGRYLATAGFTSLMRGEVKLRDAATGKELHTLPGHTGPVTGLAFAPAGGQLATSDSHGNVRLWDAATAKPLRTLRGHDGAIISLSYRPDGKRLASAGLDGTVRVWDLATGEEVLRFRGHRDRVLCVAYSPDGRRLASWGMDTYIRVWDADTGQEQLRLAGHWHRVFSLLFHKDGRHLVSAGSDGRRFWNLQTGKLERTFRGINSATFMATFSPDGRRLVFAGCDRTVQVWDWPSGREVLALRGHTAVVTAVAFSGDGHRLFSASADGTLRVWNGTPWSQGAALRHRTLAGHQGPVVGLAFSPDQRYLATGALDGTARLWDVGARKLVHTLPGQDVTSVAFHGGGKWLTTVATDGTLVQWDPATGKRRRTLRGHLGPIWNAGMSVGFSAAGDRLTTLGKDGTVRVWETDSGREVVSMSAGAAVPITAFLSPDGRRVAVAGFARVRLLEVKSKKQVAALSVRFEGASHLAFSADGRRLAVGFWDGRVRVWEIGSGKLLHTFRHSDRVACVAFHPNGKQLTSGSCDNTAKVWNLETGEEVETLRGHIGYVMALAYSSDGKLLATASGNRYQGEVQLWDTATFGKKR